VSENTPIGSDDRALDDAALELLAESLATPPPPELRARVLDAVAGEAALLRRLRRWRSAAASALAACAALVAVVARDARDDRLRGEETGRAVAALEQRASELAERVAAQQRELLVVSESLAAQSEVMRILSTPRILSASLAPQPGRTGRARVLIDPATGEAALVVSGLEPLGAQEVYELWALREKASPEPAGLLAASGPDATLRIPRVADPSRVTAFAVSVEPTGGSPQPTGPIVLAGPVGS